MIVKAWKYGDIVVGVGIFMMLLLEFIDFWIIVKGHPLWGVCVEQYFLCII